MDFHEVSSSSQEKDQRPSTYIEDAKIADAKEKLRVTRRTALTSGKDVKTYEAHIVNIGKGKDPLLVRWREDDDLEEIALLICISESLDVDLNLKQVLAQLQRQVAKGAAVAKADKVVNKH